MSPPPPPPRKPDGGPAHDRTRMVAGARSQVGPIVEGLVRFRDEVRAAAKATSPPNSALLAMCDALRDSRMADLGVRVEDKGGEEGSVWKLDDPETLRREVREKLAMAAEKAAEKVLNKLTVKAGELAKAEAASVAPSELLRQPQFSAKYGAFDEAGKPTADASGEALSKAASKEADKLLTKQQKEHAKHLEAIAKAPQYLEALRTDVGTRQAEVRELLESNAEMLSETLQKQLRAALPA